MCSVRCCHRGTEEQEGRRVESEDRGLYHQVLERAARFTAEPCQLNPNRKLAMGKRVVTVAGKVDGLPGGFQTVKI